MRTILDLPEELMREVELVAASQQRTVREVVSELLKSGLGMLASNRLSKPSDGSMVAIGESGLPEVGCSGDAPASHMTVEQLLKLEGDLDLNEARHRV